MLAESANLEKQINLLKSKIKTLPDGQFICTRNGNYYKWYKIDGGKHIYIPKANRKLAEQLAAKKYLTLLLEDLLHEKRAIDFYLKHHRTDMGKSYRLLTDMPEYKELLSPFFTPLSQELLDWMNSPYEHNAKHPEQLVHKTCSGKFVRSKSEAMIDMALYTNKIPFRYECALELGQTKVYPDFTIRHPKTGKTYYWEHFGLMDDPAYYKNAYSKLQFYTSMGIVPSIQLITTFETKETPLSLEIVEKTVEHFFL